jgi:2-dehydropantoate 2-reductase
VARQSRHDEDQEGRAPVIDASVLVVGGGAIGGITAAKLAGNVARVVVLDSNQRHVQLLREPGLVYREAGTERTVPLDAVSSVAELDGDFDFALIAVKSPFHRAALERLVPAGIVDAFVSLGNGLIQDRMAELVGADRLLSCIVEWGGTNLGPGRLVRDTIAPMVVGELDGSERERTRLLARCLESVGEVRVTHNLRGQIWSKLLVNSAFTGLSAVSGLRYGGVADHPDGRIAVYEIWAEGVAVGEAEGLVLDAVLGIEPHELVARDDAALARMMAIAGNTKPSMLQDLEQGRVTEVDVVNGGVAQRGRAHGIATPFNDRVVELVHAMERGERSPAPEELTELVASIARAGPRFPRSGGRAHAGSEVGQDLRGGLDRADRAG